LRRRIRFSNKASLPLLQHYWCDVKTGKKAKKQKIKMTDWAALFQCGTSGKTGNKHVNK
jgi:hypothetical protein